ESLFNIIQFDVEGSSFLDLFAGCGQIGIEAISRGARQVVFVDKSKKSIEVIKQNLKTTKFEKSAVVINSDSLAFLSRRAEKYDIAFLDPPYSKGILQDALERIAPVMNDGAIIICESPVNEELPEYAGRFKMFKKYSYGKTALTTYKLPEAEEDNG
ncbi:MAG: 16S rRNA (guanine(966)-N(2))-methyltransferase RsmD, partial [Acutalibacteraceae bacterium]